jgi:hypothetical protein
VIPANYPGTWTVWCADSEDPEPLARSVSWAEACELVKTTDRENVYAAPDLAADEEPQPVEVYRVWAEGLDGKWFAASHTFDAENDAKTWAQRLNLEHRVEPEDAL